MKTISFLIVTLGLAACSSGSSPSTTSGTGGTGGDSGCNELTVINYESWCSVSVNGGTASSSESTTTCIPSGTANLSATALSGFELGPAPWHDTTGDKGSGDPGTVSGSSDSTTVTVGTSGKCVWVCCPFTNGTGCPTSDQCG